MDVIFFIYGLSFLVMGLVVVIRQELESKLELSGILWILAAFGFSHGFLEWTDLWLVVRGRNDVLVAVQPAILLASYLFLFEFGRRLILISLSGEERTKSILRVPGRWIYGPLIFLILAATFLSEKPSLTFVIMSRYLVGFFGSILTGLGFRLYLNKKLTQSITIADYRIIRIGCKLSGISFIAYGFFGGLVVPSSSWFPASVINQETFFEIFHIPVQLFRAACAVTAAVSVGFLLRIFHLEGLHRLQNKVQETKQALLELSQMSRRNELILGSAAEGIFGTDIEGKTIFVNDAALSMLGFQREELMGKDIHSLTHHTTPEGGPYLLQECPIQRTMENHVMRRENNDFFWRKDGSNFPVEYTSSAIWDEDKVIGVVVAFQDISERKISENKIKHLAFYDHLTGLPNRRLLTDRINQALSASARSGRMGALMLTDIDNFKTLNDTLGHDRGDQLLKLVAERLLGCVREGDTVARFGGDEFVVMLEDLAENPEDAATQIKVVGEKILGELNKSYELGSHKHYSSSSIGVTLFSGHSNSADELLKQADLAMYQAKDSGKNNIRFFDLNMQTVVAVRAALESEIRQGLIQDEFILYYQPQVKGNGQLTGAEALIRWNHPWRGLVSPLSFIPLAEESGLILPIGRKVLETACRQLVDWGTRPELSHLTLAVNISARQFHQKDFVQQVLSVIDKTGVNPEKLKIELTESLLLDDTEEIISRMSLLKIKAWDSRWMISVPDILHCHISNVFRWIN